MTEQNEKNEPETWHKCTCGYLFLTEHDLLKHKDGIKQQDHKLINLYRHRQIEPAQFEFYDNKIKELTQKPQEPKKPKTKTITKKLI